VERLLALAESSWQFDTWQLDEAAQVRVYGARLVLPSRSRCDSKHPADMMCGRSSKDARARAVSTLQPLGEGRLRARNAVRASQPSCVVHRRLCPQGHALSALGFFLIQRQGLMERFRIKPMVLARCGIQAASRLRNRSRIPAPNLRRHAYPYSMP
jgi:hypothetical protein